MGCMEFMFAIMWCGYPNPFVRFSPSFFDPSGCRLCGRVDTIMYYVMPGGWWLVGMADMFINMRWWSTDPIMQHSPTCQWWCPLCRCVSTNLQHRVMSH